MSRSRRYKLSTVTSSIVCLFSILLIVLISLVLWQTVTFHRQHTLHTQDVLSSSLVSGSLPFALYAHDIDAIKIIVDNLLTNVEVFGVEVRDEEGAIVYKRLKHAQDTTITEKSFDIMDIRDDVNFDKFSDSYTDSKENRKIGAVTIYFTNEHIVAVLRDNLMLISFALLVFAVITIAALLTYNRTLSEYIKELLHFITHVKNDIEINSDKDIVIREFSDIFQSVDNLSKTLASRRNALQNLVASASEDKEKAEKAEAFKDEFIKSISHDIRTPAGVVCQLVESIAYDVQHADGVDALLKEKIKICLDATVRLRELIEELFDFDRFESMELSNNRERVTLNVFFNEVESLYRGEVEKKGLAFEVKYIESFGYKHITCVYIDGKKLAIVLQNLIENAIKYTEIGSIVVSWLCRQEYLEVSVKDTGKGIAADDVHRIFEKHVQLDGPSGGARKGLGLGLSYVDNILAIIDGSIDVKTHVNFGSDFTVKIPITMCHDTLLEHSIAGALKEGNYSALVIDDDEATCFAIADTLTRLGIQCDQTDVAELGYASIIENTPDVVFVDYHMPQVTGDRLVHKARMAVSGKNTLFICITADTTSATLDKIQKEFDAVLQKPIKTDRLMSVLAHLISPNVYMLSQ